MSHRRPASRPISAASEASSSVRPLTINGVQLRVRIRRLDPAGRLLHHRIVHHYTAVVLDPHDVEILSMPDVACPNESELLDLVIESLNKYDLVPRPTRPVREIESAVLSAASPTTRPRKEKSHAPRKH